MEWLVGLFGLFDFVCRFVSISQHNLIYSKQGEKEQNCIVTYNRYCWQICQL